MRSGLAAVAAIALAPGCGGSRVGAPGNDVARARPANAVSHAWSSPAELRWLRSLGAWENQFAAAARRLDATTNANNLATALTPLANCGDLLRNDVGPPPTARLRPAYALLRSSCADWRRASIQTLGGGNADTADVRVRIRRAVGLLRRADTLLPPGELRRLPSGPPSFRHSRVVPLFTKVASTLSRNHAEVRCWSRSDWSHLVREEREYSVSRVDARAVGLTSLSSRRINIDPEICVELERLVRHRPVDLPHATFAVQVLAHESQHASGIAAEAVADCYGMQAIARTAQLLGLSRSYGETLAATYWRHWRELPSIYRSGRCRNGGGLDLHPRSPSWP